MSGATGTQHPASVFHVERPADSFVLSHEAADYAAYQRERDADPDGVLVGARIFNQVQLAIRGGTRCMQR